jgi:PAS domain-containing protein
MNGGVAIVDDQLRVVFANEALLRLGQYKRDEIQGRTPDAIFPAEDVPYIVQQHESGHRYRHNRRGGWPTLSYFLLTNTHGWKYTTPVRLC